MSSIIITSRYNNRVILSIVAMFFIIGALVISGCQQKDTGNRYNPQGHSIDQRKPSAWGHEQVIYVFADDEVWKYAEQPLRKSLERYYFTTENERYFEVKRAQDIKEFYRFKNLLFLAHLDSDKGVSKYVQEKLTDTVLNSVRENGVGLFSRNNLWANEQYVVFLVGNNEVNLLRYNILEANTLFEKYKDKLYSYSERKIYGADVRNPSYFKSLPWTIKLPETYVVYKQDLSNNFISFLARRRDNPDRYIGIYYEEMKENKMSTEWLLEKRANLAWDYYEEDEFSPADVRTEKIIFAGYDAVKVAGRWQNQKYAVGGAFQSFGFYDENTNSAWLIDNSVFYPEGYKLPALIEMEIISGTITIKNDRQE